MIISICKAHIYFLSSVKIGKKITVAHFISENLNSEMPLMPLVVHMESVKDQYFLLIKI